MTMRFSLRQNRNYRLSGGLLAAMLVVMAGAVSAHAAQVSGMMIAYEGGDRQQGRHLHFENEVTHDCYMAKTGTDGGFGAHLPPGVYDLRAERGAMLKRAIVVVDADIALGQVNDLAPYTPLRLWYLQSIAESQLSSPAPSTANILTADLTKLPPGRQVIIAHRPELPPMPDLPAAAPGPNPFAEP